MADKKDLLAEAKSFCDGLSNVFMLKKRDAQTRHLLEKAKSLVEALAAEHQKQSGTKSTPPRQARGSGGMGQLWTKLEELKRENELLKRKGKAQDDRGTSGTKTQGPGEVIISELHKAKQENEVLRNRNEKLEVSNREMEAVAVSVQDEYKRSKVALETTQKSMETVLKEYRHMEDSLKSAKTENDTLKQRVTQSVKPLPTSPKPLPPKPVAKPVPKARSMSHGHVEPLDRCRSGNRVQTETLSERCRPSNVAMLYTSLESQEWVDAKEALEDDYDFEEENIIQFLCTILMEAFKTCKEVHETLKATIAELLKKPTLAVSLDFGGEINYRYKLPDCLTDGVGQQLRQHYDEIESETIVNIMSKKLAKDYRSFAENNCLQHKSIYKYMHACATVTWQMVVQQPQMYLTVDDKKFDDDKHKLWWSCDQKSANNVDFFIWPALYDYKNGILLVKGCVYAS
ncbi:uncharacterized protein LOC110447158 [Mizuhopecten yessoensis]|uniref:Mitochondria-eating protein n=1 Tax=Mizuhopecten yessoensis TaxID=6573 RepID=A0A210QW65_MIZYE|nr:uncharacterized protein LOC110447158 [Mizuhopecten yessoensis]OWF52902.1 hypothetical protein KP79_PYT12893 [Mizuhopecten yessoensis]